MGKTEPQILGIVCNFHDCRFGWQCGVCLGGMFPPVDQGFLMGT